MNNLHYDCILETVNLLLFKCLIDPVYHCILKSRKNYHPQFRDTKLDELNKIIVKESKTTEFLTILKIYRNY